METAKLGASKVKHAATTVSKWNTQRSACVFHFPTRGDKNQKVQGKYVLRGNEHRICWHKSQIHTASGCGLFQKSQEVYEEK